MEEKRINRNYAAMMAEIVLSVLCIIAGAILSIDKAFPVIGFVYVMSGFAIVGGVWLVLRFFMNEEYRAVSNFDSSGEGCDRVLHLCARLCPYCARRMHPSVLPAVCVYARAIFSIS